MNRASGKKQKDGKIFGLWDVMVMDMLLRLHRKLAHIAESRWWLKEMKMGSLLDLEDVVYDHPKAAEELSELYSELGKLRSYKERVQHRWNGGYTLNDIGKAIMGSDDINLEPPLPQVLF